MTDWPAWIALATAIISPVVTVFLNNRHSKKMLLLQHEFDTQESLGCLLSELIAVGSMKVTDFNGFSEKALSLFIYADPYTTAQFMKFCEVINKKKNYLLLSSNQVGSKVTVDQLQFYEIFKDEKKTGNRYPNYHDIVIEIIMRLRKAKMQKNKY